MSLDGFLAFLEERPKGERWELDDRVPLMSQQPTRRHDWIQVNILEALRQHRRRHASPWRPSGPSQVPVPGAARTVAPDILVAPDDGRHDLCITPAPVVVFEVLSPSDRPRRRASKLAAYAAVPSIQSVVLVRQDRRSVTVHRRSTDGGFSVMTCTETVDMPEIGVALSFETIYDDTPLACRPPPQTHSSMTAIDPANRSASLDVVPGLAIGENPGSITADGSGYSNQRSASS